MTTKTAKTAKFSNGHADAYHGKRAVTAAWIAIAAIFAIVLFAGAQEPVSARDDFNDFFIPLHAAPSK